MAYSKKQIEDTFNYICNKIQTEAMSLRSILREDNMPESHTFYKWIDNDKNKLLQYARATETRADLIFEDILIISDKQGEDVYTDTDGVEHTNHNVINRSRLMVDSRKWMLGKMQPKKYGDKSTLALEGGDKPIEISFED